MTQGRCNRWRISLFLALSVTASLCTTAVCAVAQPERPQQEGQPQRGNERPSRRSGPGIDIGGIFNLLFNRGGGGEQRKVTPFEDVTENGPQIPEDVSMSNFSVLGFCQGGWPFVIEYELDKPGQCWIEISNETADFFYRLDGSKLGRQMLVLDLPARFGEKPNLARFVVRSLTEGLREIGPCPVYIYSMGCGKTAVGSVTIDQITFQPPSINVSRKESAVYSFRSLRDFGKARVEFCRLSEIGGEVRRRRVKTVTLDSGLKRDERYGVDKPALWDGKANPKEVSIGHHRIQVRVWTNPASDGSWLFAGSRDQVEVREQ